MKLTLMQASLGAARRATAILLALLVGSIAANLVLAIFAVRASGQERIVVIPPTVHKTFWVAQDRVSAEYLEQMGYFLMQLILNVTPQSVDHQSRLLLQYASPSAFGELRTQLSTSAERLKRDSAATVFSAQDLSVDEQHLRVGIRGQLSTFVSDRRVSDVVKGYALEFQYSGGRITLKSFRETHPNDPLDAKNIPGTADAGR
jgi:conjugal transfer pilus assembly protein TraE